MFDSVSKVFIRFCIEFEKYDMGSRMEQKYEIIELSTQPIRA